MGPYARLLCVLCTLLFFCTSAQATELPNILQNPFMESWSGTSTANNWMPFVYRTVPGSSGSPVFYKSPTPTYNHVFEGSFAQGIDLTNIPRVSDPAAQTRAGVYQRIQGATPGKVYFLASWVMLKTNVSSQAFACELGIDPYGGTDPASPNVRWSDGAWNHYDRVRGIWNMITFACKAQSSTITIFLRSTTLESVSRSGGTVVVFDKAALYAIEDNVQLQLANGGFESGFDTFGGYQNPPTFIRQKNPGNPVSWVPFGSSEGYSDAYDIGWNKLGQCGSYMSDGLLDADLNGELDNYHIRTGSHSLWMMNNKGTCNWGVYQRVAAAPGQPYTLTGWINGPGAVQKQAVGMDPTGGTDPDSPYVVWSTAIGCGTWAKHQVCAQAAGDIITVFLYINAQNKAGGNETKFDDVELVQGNTVQPAEVYAVTSPTANSTGSTSQYVTVNWTGDAHDAFEVRITRTDIPGSPIVWDSGPYTSYSYSITAGPLPVTGSFNISIRLHNQAGWGSWSAPVAYNTALGWRIIPTPQQMTPNGQTFTVDQNTKIIIPPSPTQDDLFAADQLRRKISRTTGITVPVVEYTSGADLQGAIALGQIDANLQSDNPAVAQMLASWPEAAGKTPRREGSLLGIRAGGIVVAGFDAAGTFYACQSIIQLLEQMEGAPLPGLFIYDWPDLQTRGVLLRWWGFYERFDMDFAEEVVSEVVSRYKLNALELEMRLGMRYDSHPDLFYAENACSKEEVREFCRMMRRYHVEPIAGGMSTTHADQWITDSHPQLAVPGRLSDLDIDNPETQSFIRSIIEEQIEVCSPRIVLIGGDEGSISADYTLRCIHWIHDNVLVPNNVTGAIWGDMIKNSGLGPSLYKDIIVQDWGYSSDKTNFSDLAIWESLGLSAWVAPYGVYVNNKVPGPYNILYSAISAEEYGSEGLVAFNKAILGTKYATLWRWDDFRNEHTWAFADYALSNYAMYPFYGEWAWNAPARPGTRPSLPFDGGSMFLRQFAPDKPVMVVSRLDGSSAVLNWKAPVQTTCMGVRVAYRYDRYPQSPEDGIMLCDVPVFATESAEFTHQSVPKGAKVYYSFFAYDRLKHYSPAAHSSVSNGEPLNLSQVKAEEDGTAVFIGGKVVTAVFQGCFYVEEPDRSAAIGVISDQPVKEGDVVDIAGSLTLVNGERKIMATWVSVSTSSQPLPGALGLGSREIGGSPAGSQSAVWSWRWVRRLVDGKWINSYEWLPSEGLNNTAMLVKTCGRTIDKDPAANCIFIDDGYSLKNYDKSRTGLKVRVPFDIAALKTGDFVSVTGISSCCKDESSDKMLPMILARKPEDIMILQNR